MGDFGKGLKRWILGYSYTAKTRFAGSIACLCCFVVLGALFLSQHRAIQILETKRIGLDRHCHIITLLRKSSTLLVDAEGRDKDDASAEASSLLERIDHNYYANDLDLTFKVWPYIFGKLMAKEVPSLQVDIARHGSTIASYAENLSERLNRISMHIDIEKELNVSSDKESYEELRGLLGNYKRKVEGLSVNDAASAQVALVAGWALEQAIVDKLRWEVSNALDFLIRRQVVSTLIVAIGLVIFSLLYLNRVVRRPLEDLQFAADSLRSGNLSSRAPVTSRDEVAEISVAFNEMAELWEKNIGQAKALASSLFDSNNHIFSIADVLEGNIKKQDRAIALLAQQEKEIAKIVQKFAVLLGDVKASVKIMRTMAVSGRENLGEMEAIMYQMGSVAKEVVAVLLQVKGHVEKISGVIHHVVAIADQSNLLSINTAVRANKVGVQGRGFSVVADKIGELAIQTADATLGIEHTVDDMVRVVDGAVSGIENFVAEVLGQIREEQEIQEQLRTRVDDTEKQMGAFDKISQDIEEQLQDSLKMRTQITSLNRVTKKTNETIESLHDDAAGLNKDIATLDDLLKQFS